MREPSAGRERRWARTGLRLHFRSGTCGETADTGRSQPQLCPWHRANKLWDGERSVCKGPRARARARAGPSDGVWSREPAHCPLTQAAGWAPAPSSWAEAPELGQNARGTWLNPATLFSPLKTGRYGLGSGDAEDRVRFMKQSFQGSTWQQGCGLCNGRRRAHQEQGWSPGPRNALLRCLRGTCGNTAD